MFAITYKFTNSLIINILHYKFNNITYKFLEELLINGLKDNKISFCRNGSANHIAGNISLSFPAADGESLLHRLDLMGISVSTGSACDSKETQISHVLKAINLNEAFAKGTIRVSFGHQNTVQEVKTIVAALIKIIGDPL